MKIKNILPIFPFIFSSILILSCFKTDISPKPILFYSATAILICGCAIGLFLKKTNSAWFYVWMVFGSMFGIMSLDQMLFNSSTFWRFFQDSVRGFDDLFFPSPIPFRGLIPLLLFYIVFCHNKSAIRINENEKYAIVIAILYCFFYFITPLYYGTPGVLMCLNFNGGSGLKMINLSVLVSTILFACFVLFILMKGFGRLRLVYLVSFFLLFFVTMHAFVLLNAFKSGRWDCGFTLGDIIYLFRLYLKYIWLLSGAAYMLLLLEYQSFKANRPLSIQKSNK
ncbi:MAG: hypothetical protein MUF15_09010 [Acidobacteria bacterium]|jgi:hypothetical protein|nr:hypothetical protein [Acidobacteriota bacterium]